METESLKRKSIIGTLWSFIETFSLKLIQFIINVIMARLLMPEDYGVITIVYTLIVISQVFIDGGFATTLIQDKHKSEKDYSTIFTFNVFVSILCYLLLFSIAPLLSEFYNTIREIGNPSVCDGNINTLHLFNISIFLSPDSHPSYFIRLSNLFVSII